MTTILAPARTDEQRMAGLRKANRIRSYRSQVKRQLRGRSASISLLLSDPMPEILTMKVEDLLLALPGHGPTKVRRLMNHCRISTTKTVGGMSDRQRADLLAVLA